MMDLSEFKKWRSSRPTEMRELAFACPDDIFIFARMNIKNISEGESKYVIYAEDIKEAKWFICHIFLYDILNDAADDLEFDFKTPFNERQKDAIMLLKFWFQMSKKADMSFKDLTDFCKQFNSYFNNREDIQYEIEVLNGAQELHKFLKAKFSDNDIYNEEKLINICSSDSFSGKLLKDYLDIIFN